MNILVMGSGGREHALCWKISQSNKLDKLYCAPGNSGTALHGENISLNISDFKEVEKFVRNQKIDMIVVGPEAPLVDGIHDYFKESTPDKKVAVIGPEKKAAMLEGSKDFAKKFMVKNNIPTAGYKSFDQNTINDAFDYLETKTPPFVIKADGLAAGKGVLICNTMAEAKQELNEMLKNKKFGSAGDKVVIEDFLEGTELSVFILTDGKDYVLLPEAKDYKRIGENDTGLNTGGMGSISPVPFANDIFMKKVEDKIIKPSLNGLNKENITYKGFIFFGLINIDGEPFVIEYNARMGDPEAESVIPRIQTDMVDLFKAVAEDDIASVKMNIDPRHSAAVMIVSGGYPGSYEKNKEISGLDKVSDAIIFHAGARLENNKVLTNGGRVMALTGMGNTMKEALDKAYCNTAKIKFDKMYYRKDLGNDLNNY